jgi:hypothetical protein
MGEGFSLVRKFGVAPQVLNEVMTDGLFACSAYKAYGKIIVEESYDRVGQMAILGLKDANLALAAGEAVGVPLPSGNVWRDRLVGAVAHGDGGKDWAVMALEQARASGLGDSHAAHGRRWLAEYRRARIERDPDRAAALFTDGVIYREQPYDELHRPVRVRLLARATATQEAVELEYGRRSSSAIAPRSSGG